MVIIRSLWANIKSKELGEGGSKMQDIRQIEIIIQELRARLHNIARERSLTDPEVVKASQELDAMLIKYERFFKMKINDDFVEP